MTRKGKTAALSRKAVWNFGPLAAGDEDQGLQEKTAEGERRSYEFIDKWRPRQDYLRDPAALREALDDYEMWKRCWGTDGDEGYYFWLRTQQDQNDPNLKARFNKIEESGRKIENDIQFFHLRIANIPARLQKKFLDYEGLRRYRHFLERIFAESRYLLSEAEERILNLKTPTSYSNWVRMTSGLLSAEQRTVMGEDGSRGVKTFAEIASLMNSRQRKVRAAAAKGFNDILLRHLDVAEAEINSILANKKTDDELRKVARPDLTRHIGDDIESEVVDALIKSVSRRFDIPSRYYRLKARLLGVKQLKYHERNVEYGDIDRKYPWHAADKLVSRVLYNLDREFGEIHETFRQKGLIDVYPRKGKTGGAFCAHHLISQPTFILLNHTGRLRDVLTLAHELGHGINNELMRKKQNSLNFGTPASTAEVASTFMEDFVLQEILLHSGEELRLSLMVMKLDEEVSTIFRQVACYMFEQELHGAFRAKGYLSKDEIGKMFAKHMAAYMGESVEQTGGSENWWVYWNHIRYFFYVYSYAGGLLISKSLQNSVKRDPGYIAQVKGFLSAGLSDSPRNIFLKLGIDVTDADFWNRGLGEVEGLLEETTSLAVKLGKIS
jgi:oligoendopeptidase F